jgi:serine-type D-Ala-D-Ala carboxypeptidase/endopeptidase (penicillin-binding protein 4)
MRIDPRLSAIGGVLASALVLSVIVGAPAHAAVPVGPSDGTHLDRLLEHRLHDKRLGHDVGLIVVDDATGEILAAHNANRRLQAASNMKLVTATNALATLGPDHPFFTRVLAGPTPADIVLQGGGDPLLTRDNLDALAARTALSLAPGADVVVHVDGDIFPEPSLGPGWVTAYLGSSVGSTQALALQGDRSLQPARLAAEIFAADLAARGLNANVGGNLDAAVDAPLLAQTVGHTVAEAIAVMLRESDSAIAEVLFRHVAIAVGAPPTWEGARTAAEQTMLGLGMNLDGQVLADGSGLSRDDRLSPRFLADLLRLIHVAQAPRFAAIFAHDALPTAGRTGTLTPAYGRYAARPSRCAVGRVQAKTGTILSTIALSGIARTVTGGTRIFSIIVNDRPLRFSALDTRHAVDGLAATITGCWR